MTRSPGELLECLGGKKKLSSAELEFMEYIWSCPDGVSSEAIYRHFPQTRGTKSTILYKISEKGYVTKVQRGVHHYYTALVSEEEYHQALIKQQLNKSFGDSSFERMVAMFCGKRALSEDEAARARKLLEEISGNTGEEER